MADDAARRGRTFGRWAAWTVAALGALYAPVTALGFRALPSADAPIGPPWVTLMEGLILLMAPALVATMAAVRLAAGPRHEVYGATALALMTVAAGLTAAVHVVVLTTGGVMRATDPDVAARLTAFTWPSAAYALDILAWDGFYALSLLAAAPVFAGDGATAWARRLLVAAGLLSLAGLAGMPLDDMRVRNVGIVGYAVVAPVAFVLVGVVLGRPPAAPAPPPAP
jgi:hypothetical protein